MCGAVFRTVQGENNNYCISREFDWKNIGNLESICIWRIKFDDCLGSLYYF